MKDTKFYRETSQDFPLPYYFIPISELGNGEIFCLDTANLRNGECPVIAWYFGSVEKIAEDFGKFLLKQVKDGLSFLESIDKEH